MKKLVTGIVEFRKTARPDYAQKFAQLALGQSPDTLFIACSDSRVVPNLFASTDPGDLFVIRNVGNLIPPCTHAQTEPEGFAEGAAIDFAVMNLKISDIIVCGHSDCGAMHALIEGRENVRLPHLKEWLKNGDASLLKLKSVAKLGTTPQPIAVSDENRLSQINVLQQIDHLMTYESVRARVQGKTLRLHAWWFELGGANVHAYNSEVGAFVLIDDTEAARILASLS